MRLAPVQLAANAVLFASVNLSGVFVRIVTERTQRKVFLQARSCIEERLRLEDENEKQVSLRRLLHLLHHLLFRSLSPAFQVPVYSNNLPTGTRCNYDSSYLRKEQLRRHVHARHTFRPLRAHLRGALTKTPRTIR